MKIEKMAVFSLQKGEKWGKGAKKSLFQEKTADFFFKKSFRVNFFKGKRKRLSKKFRKSNFQQQPRLDHFMWNDPIAMS